IKPDTGYVRSHPDIYKNDITYVPCRPDFSDLEEKIRYVLNNYDEFKTMRINNRKLLDEVNEKDCADRFWKLVLKILNK
ncbi:MAG: hypothetical protein MJH11_08635, partial [Lentisphaeria bacterium]|nr:hypothetical protein [Lentisphaeria bacterium]